MSRAGSHGSKRFLSNRVTVVRRLLRNQKTVYDLKLLVIFLKKSVIFFKKSVMFFKKLVMFYQSLAGPCCFPVCWLIIYKSALDKICLIHDVKEWICKISSTFSNKLLIVTTIFSISQSFQIKQTYNLRWKKSIQCEFDRRAKPKKGFINAQ